LSVIICTHNPREDFLIRVFESLKTQTLKLQSWELLIIDNGSKIPVAASFDSSWHPYGRHIREDKLGLTPARIRGIKASKANSLLFVDDDNCLDRECLEIALNTIRSNSLLGVLGAGRILPEFEEEPLPEVTDFMIMLALRDEVRSYYSNEINWGKAIPYGAGMLIRKAIALDYMASCEGHEFAASLDRSGNTLLSGGDVDMALHACSKQYLAGVIPELKLTHIIPKSRLNTGYLVRLAAGHAFSHYILGRMWGYRQDYPENR